MSITTQLYRSSKLSGIHQYGFSYYCILCYLFCIVIVYGQDTNQQQNNKNNTSTSANNNDTSTSNDNILTVSERNCLQSILDSDTNSDRLLNRSEFTLFRDDLCNSTTTTNTSIETSTFFALACVCQQEEVEQNQGTNNSNNNNNSDIGDCCVGSKARINVTGIVRILNEDDDGTAEANTTTPSLKQRFNSICLVVSSSCTTTDSDDSTILGSVSEIPSISPNFNFGGGGILNSTSDIPSSVPTSDNENSDIPSKVPSINPILDTIMPTRRPRRQSRQPESVPSSTTSSTSEILLKLNRKAISFALILISLNQL